MNGRAVALALILAAGIGLAFVWRRAGASVAPGLATEPESRADDAFDDGFTSTIIFPIESVTMRWLDELRNGRGAPYAAMLAAAEQAHGIPQYMLARLAWQESHFRADIISGKVKSSAGALGLMQIVPRWHPDVNPLDTPAAINYAGKYLRSLYRQFGTWQLALMAYNWGPGNVSKWRKNGGSVPSETMNYQADILADVRQVNTSTGIAWA